ncbi:MAG: DUF4389 domain-containing protein [Sneathiella sp.]
METQTEQNLKSKSTWGRLLYIILYAICFNVAEIVLAAIAIVQFFSSLITGAPLKQLRSFGTALSDYLRQLADFLTYASDAKPFPVGPWPTERHIDEANEDGDDTIIISPASK